VWDKNSHVFAIEFVTISTICHDLKARQEEREQSASSANHPWPEKGPHHQAVERIGFGGVSRRKRDTEICQVQKGFQWQMLWKSPQEIMVNPSKKSGHLLLLVVTLWFSIILKMFNKIYLFRIMIFHGKLCECHNQRLFSRITWLPGPWCAA